MERIVGINAATARLSLGSDGIRRLCLKEDSGGIRLEKLRRLAEDLGVPVETVTAEALDRLTDLRHQGAVLEVEPMAPRQESFLDEVLASADHDLMFLVLDSITDPRNLGACLRSAATMGADAVVVPKDHSASLTESAVRTAAGGASIVPFVQVVNLARCLEKLKRGGVWVVGTTLDAPQALDEIPLTGHVALVMGAEDKGLRQKTINRCDFLARIPMAEPALGFNVAVATGICLYEAWRQRHLQPK